VGLFVGCAVVGVMDGGNVTGNGVGLFVGRNVGALVGESVFLSFASTVLEKIRHDAITIQQLNALHFLNVFICLIVYVLEVGRSGSLAVLVQ